MGTNLRGEDILAEEIDRPRSQAASMTPRRIDSVPETPDFAALTAAAQQAMQQAYAPYSGYPVGAAALTDTGQVMTGCNVENASYGVGLCAECTLVGQLQMSGSRELKAFTCVNSEGETIMPCGRCRQLLNEFAADDFTILTPEGVRSWNQVLPQAFGPKDLRQNHEGTT